MKKLMIYVLLMLVLVNAAVLLADHFVGRPFVFNFALNLVSPVLTGIACWLVEKSAVKP